MSFNYIGREPGILRLLSTGVFKTEYSTTQGMSLTGHAFFSVTPA